MNKKIISAHEYSIDNKAHLTKSSVCGCFHCLKIFSPDEITQWVKDKDETALCPYCQIDSVIGDGSGYEITDEFLKEMKNYWF